MENLLERLEALSVTKYALLIAPHVFVRPGELRHAEWNEFDFHEGVWKIPRAR